MALLGWLDVLPSGARRGLLAATAVGLGAPSATLGMSGLDPIGQDVVAGGAVLVVGVLWLGAFFGLARPELERREREAAEARVRREHDPGLLAAAGPVDLLDPAFSLPVLHEIVLARVGQGDVVRVIDVRRVKDGTVLVALVEAPGRCRRVQVSRAPDAVSPSPDRATEEGAGGWRVTALEDVERPPDPPIAPSPTVPAARRALLARAEAFDLEAFEALLDELCDALQRVGETPDAAEPYTTVSGARALEFWRSSGGLPPLGDDHTWLEVEEDGWYERIEIRSGACVLGLLRPSGEPDAPWRLWRVRRSP